jgi:hypothetical protein
MKIFFTNFELLIVRRPKHKYNKNDLVRFNYTPEQLFKKITGAIKSCCDQHPQVPRSMIQSIAKRVYCQLLAVNGIPKHLIEKE